MPACSGMGTRIYANKKDGTVTIIHPSNEQYQPPSDSVEILGVNQIDIRINPNDIIQAEIELACDFEPMEAEPTYYVINPKTGQLEPVKFIEFESGEQWKHDKQ